MSRRETRSVAPVGTAAPLVQADPWDALRRFTPARIALGRAGNSLPTAALLEFGLAQAQARDAVHAPSQQRVLIERLHALKIASIDVRSRAADRAEYLRRPDRGRRLDDASRSNLQQLRSCAGPDGFDLVVVLADGLSPLAAARHGIDLLQQLLAALSMTMPGLRIGPVVVADMARVALGDEIGELLGARLIAVCIGERPGLSAADSLGIYLTHEPRIGRRDAERNCLSNVRPEGLATVEAAHRLAGLIAGARRLERTGVELKDEADRAGRIAPGRA